MELFLEFVVLIIVATIFGYAQCSPSWEERYYARREFYEKREREYIDALPPAYPYIAGWDGYEFAYVKTGECSWASIPMEEAVYEFYIHPALYFDSYVGDGYMSTNQMRQDFENEENSGFGY